jgi:arsenate reductase
MSTPRRSDERPSQRPVRLHHNSGRSVAAQALTRHYAGDAVEVRSAGSEPGAGVNPVVAEVLAERGLPVTDHVPTKLDDEIVGTADVVITMGCGETCPVFSGKRYEDWPVDDPAGQDLATARRIVDDIDARVRILLRDILLAPRAAASDLINAALQDHADSVRAENH